MYIKMIRHKNISKGIIEVQVLTFTMWLAFQRQKQNKCKESKMSIEKMLNKEKRMTIIGILPLLHVNDFFYIFILN